MSANLGKILKNRRLDYDFLLKPRFVILNDEPVLEREKRKKRIFGEILELTIRRIFYLSLVVKKIKACFEKISSFSNHRKNPHKSMSIF